MKRRALDRPTLFWALLATADAAVLASEGHYVGAALVLAFGLYLVLDDALNLDGS